MSFFRDIYNGSITINQLLSLFKLVCLILLPFIIIYIVILTISLWKIFEKEKINKIYALIPFFNLYCLFNIIDIPSIYAFIPILNILILIFMPYNLAKQYGLSENKSVLAIIFPYYFLPYIAFSKNRNRDEKVSFNYIQYTKQIDDIENEFKKMPSDGGVIDDNNYINTNTNVVTQTEDSFIDKMNYNVNDDEYIENEDITPYKQHNAPSKRDVEEIVDLEDEDNAISLSNIDTIDKNIEESSKADIKVQQDIKDYEKEGPSISAVAFGGKEEKENLVTAKKDEHKCPRCGSDLVGVTDRCPGCGLEVKNIS